MNLALFLNDLTFSCLQEVMAVRKFSFYDGRVKKYKSFYEILFWD